MTASEQWVLQLCHGYDGPFLDCARQYAALFVGTTYKVCTVYLTGDESDEVVRGSASDEVIFLGYESKAVRGLKIGALRALKRIVKGRDFHFCIAHRFKPTYLALLCTRLPVIGINHAFGVYQRRYRRLFANLYRRRLALLGVSDAVRDDIRACLPGWPGGRIETLYNRIDIGAVQSEQVDRSEARAYLGLPAGAWVVGNVGRLHPDKDQATLIRGFAKALPWLPENSWLVIIGVGRLEARLKMLASELSIAERVRFTGSVPQARRFFKAFDVFALSSDHEPFGMVLLEAMAAHVPVICSDCGGGREVVCGVGALFPFGNADALAEQIVTSTSMPVDSGRFETRLHRCFTDEAATARFWALLSNWGVKAVSRHNSSASQEKT
ncbi:glycosyltransferase [Pseudomonas sp. PS1]|uniref:Glycosyltransferase n=1 Tax=Stutzerimonas marianensis TaxID=2929513 RepID=A0A9X2ATE0_9GAMM|nr:glycosyltransferase [Pseudomonas marianensis]MCJ0971886.1 glycosyltransferase [Pseudomonas marianensis]